MKNNYGNAFFNQVLTKHSIQNSILTKIKKGTFITHESQPIQSFYFIVEGTVKVFQDFRNGKRFLLGFFLPPQILGDVEYSLGLPNATCSVQAVTDIYCYKFNYEEIKKKYQNDIEFNKFFVKQLSNKLLTSNNRISINLMYPLEARLASYLLSTYLINQSEYIELINLSDLANHLGTSYRHLHRTFQKLINKNILEKEGHNIKIIDVDKLTVSAENNIYEMENNYVIER